MKQTVKPLLLLVAVLAGVNASAATPAPKTGLTMSTSMAGPAPAPQPPAQRVLQGRMEVMDAQTATPTAVLVVSPSEQWELQGLRPAISGSLQGQVVEVTGYAVRATGNGLLRPTLRTSQIASPKQPVLAAK